MKYQNRPRLPLPKLERHYFHTSDGARLAYYVTGARTGQPLLITAGLGGGVRAWAALIPRLMREFRIYAWDYRGLYASATSGAPPAALALTVEQHARDLADLVDHLNLHREQRPILAGWSMGVQVMFELGRNHPHIARAIIALNGAPGAILSAAFNGNAFERMSPSIFAAMQAYGDSMLGPARHLARSRRFALGFMRFARRAKLMSEAADPDIFHDMARDWVRLDLSTYATIFGHLADHDARDVLPLLTAPALVIAGSVDPFTPLRFSEEIVELMPNAKLHVIPNATHFAPLEYPDEIVAAIRDFASEHGLMTP